jgi:repressor LexA
MYIKQEFRPMKNTSKNRPLPSVSPLSEKEKAVLAHIENCLSQQGISPSYQEIKDHFGFASLNSVQNYLKQLVAKGYIAIPTHQKRAIQILHPSNSVQEAVQQLRKQKPVATAPQTSAMMSSKEVFSLPLLGKVAAGQPLEAFSHDEFVDVPPSMVRNPSKTFALKVSGSSMIDDGIHDGDVILVQKQASVTNGEIVVASIENESTVKRYFLRPHPQQQEKMVELRPANSTMKSMWYPPDQVDIQGVLVGLIRTF